jgi:hypothetical protein
MITLSQLAARQASKSLILEEIIRDRIKLIDQHGEDGNDTNTPLYYETCITHHWCSEDKRDRAYYVRLAALAISVIEALERE